jgi:hypothetical protein
VHVRVESTIMAFHVRDEATDEAVRRLAKLKGKTLTETIREAVEGATGTLGRTPSSHHPTTCNVRPD